MASTSGDDPELRSTIGWWSFALALVVVLAYTLGAYLGWIVFGIFLYYVARPVARELRRRGLSGTAAAVLTLGLVVLPFVVVLVVLAAVAFVQLATLEATDLERLVETLFPDVDSDALPSTEAELYSFVEGLATDPTVGSAIEVTTGVLGRFLSTSYFVILTFLFAFFLVRDERRLAEWIEVELLTGRPHLATYLRRVDEGLRSIFFGYTLTILAITLLAGIVYAGFNVVAPPGIAIPQVALLAIVTGLASVIPLLGRTIVYAGIVTYLAVMAVLTDPAALWFPIVFSLVMGILFDGIIRTYVRPVLSGGLFHTGFVLFAYVLGPVAFGWYGIFLGPILMVVTVVFIRTALPRLLRGDAMSREADATDGR